MRILASWLADFVDLSGDGGIDALPSLLMRFGVEIASREEKGGEMVLEIEVTANRPDLLSHFGIARELAAGLGRTLREPEFLRLPAAGGQFPISIDTDHCPCYAGLVLRNVKLGDSPEAVARRLRLIGENTISNVVDATNYELFEWNHPVHAFDLDKIDGRIVVRQAENGETIRLLDGKDYSLTREDMVVADASRPLALAGVMGGLDSAVTSVTRNVLLEAAWFSPLAVRRTARRFRISTDSSYRFERGADPSAPVRAIGRLAKLIRDGAGGEIEGGVIEARRGSIPTRRIAFRSSAVRRLLGRDVRDSGRILASIGCNVDGEFVEPPSWRGDLAKEVDLVEEIARHDGFDRIGLTLPTFSGRSIDFNASLPKHADPATFRRFKSTAVETCLAFGLDRCCTFSFERAAFGAVAIRDPINDEMNRLRFSLLPALCRVAQLRIDRAVGHGARLFEIEKVFDWDGASPEERVSVSAVMCGDFAGKRYDQLPEDPASLDHAIGLLKALGRGLRSPLAIGPKGGAGGRMAGFFRESAAIELGGEKVGLLGLLDVSKVLGERSAASSSIVNFYALELDLTAVFLATGGPRHAAYRPISRYPASSRDVAFLVPVSRAAGEVLAAVHATNAPALESAEIFDIFEKKGGAEKSVAVRLVFRSNDRTLTDEEVATAVTAIIERVNRKP